MLRVKGRRFHVRCFVQGRQQCRPPPLSLPRLLPHQVRSSAVRAAFSWDVPIDPAVVARQVRSYETVATALRAPWSVVDRSNIFLSWQASHKPFSKQGPRNVRSFCPVLLSCNHVCGRETLYSRGKAQGVRAWAGSARRVLFPFPSLPFPSLPSLSPSPHPFHPSLFPLPPLWQIYSRWLLAVVVCRSVCRHPPAGGRYTRHDAWPWSYDHKGGLSRASLC